MLWDIRNYLVNDILQISDSASMNSSLELRVPFLDKSLLEFAFSIPINKKLNVLHKKIILKLVAEKYLPKNIIYRRKQGFSFSLNLWLKGYSHSSIREKLKSDVLVESVGEKYIDNIIHNHFSLNNDMSVQIYSMYILNKWLNFNKLN